jgi:phage I-like protein
MLMLMLMTAAAAGEPAPEAGRLEGLERQLGELQRQQQQERAQLEELRQEQAAERAQLEALRRQQQDEQAQLQELQQQQQQQQQQPSDGTTSADAGGLQELEAQLAAAAARVSELDAQLAAAQQPQQSPRQQRARQARSTGDSEGIAADGGCLPSHACLFLLPAPGSARPSLPSWPRCRAGRRCPGASKPARLRRVPAAACLLQVQAQTA